MSTRTVLAVALLMLLSYKVIIKHPGQKNEILLLSRIKYDHSKKNNISAQQIFHVYVFIGYLYHNAKL